MPAIRRIAWIALPIVLLVVGPGPATAGDERFVTVPRAEGLRLDGKADEAAWASAPLLPVGPVTAPFPPSDAEADAPERRELRPEVRVLHDDARLVFLVRVDEPPGVGMGLALRIATEPATGDPAVVDLAYQPQDVRAPRYAARGTRGLGRGVYALRGGADLAAPQQWTLELGVPLAALGLEDASASLALVLAVRTRTPSITAWAPPGAAFQGPTSTAALRLRPAGPGGWGTTSPPDAPDPDLLAEDAQDEARLQAWLRFAARDGLRPEGPDGLLAASGVLDRRDGVATPEDELAAGLQMLVAPLEEVVELRPDLAMAHVVRGHVLHQLGLDAAALQAFETARAAVPGLREAEAGIWLTLKGPALARGAPGEPTDFEAALARAEAARADAHGPVARDGVAFGRALLDYLRGEFEPAARALGRLAGRYPHAPSVVLHAERARQAAAAWERETYREKRDDERGDLPRVRFVTTRGTFVLELFEDDFPNTVKHFVWLVRQGVYDETVLDGVVPYVGVRAGGSDPGYAIGEEHSVRTAGLDPERSRERTRNLFRGRIALLSVDPQRQRSGFVLTTGTALHAEPDFVAFGRVVAGQEVVDALTPSERIERAEVVRVRDGTEYRPTTARGLPAPER